MRCFSISNLIGNSELDDCRETRSDHHDVVQRSPPGRASTPYHGVAPLPIKRKRPPEGGRHALASVIEGQRE